jgi:hypothetical protein
MLKPEEERPADLADLLAEFWIGRHGTSSRCPLPAD